MLIVGNSLCDDQKRFLSAASLVLLTVLMRYILSVNITICKSELMRVLFCHVIFLDKWKIYCGLT